MSTDTAFALLMGAMALAMTSWQVRPIRRFIKKTALVIMLSAWTLALAAARARGGQPYCDRRKRGPRDRSAASVRSHRLLGGTRRRVGDPPDPVAGLFRRQPLALTASSAPQSGEAQRPSASGRRAPRRARDAHPARRRHRWPGPSGGARQRGCDRKKIVSVTGRERGCGL